MTIEKRREGTSRWSAAVRVAAGVVGALLLAGAAAVLAGIALTRRRVAGPAALPAADVGAPTPSAPA